MFVIKTKTLFKAKARALILLLLALIWTCVDGEESSVMSAATCTQTYVIDNDFKSQ